MVKFGQSALRRTALTLNPIAYWPMEDGASATSAGSGLPAGKPLDPVLSLGGVPQFGSTEIDTPGTAAMVDLTNGGRLTAQVDTSSAAAWTFSEIIHFRSVVGSVDISQADVYADLWHLNIIVVTDQLFADIYYDGSAVVSLTGPVIDDDTTHHLAVTFEQNGSDVDVGLWMDGSYQDTDTITSKTLATPDRVAIGDPGTAVVTEAGPLVAHAALYAGSSVDLADAMAAYAGEDAVTRIVRLCAEDGLRLHVDGGSSRATVGRRMGPQPVGSLLELLRECEAVDGGVLYERDWGLGYQPLDQRYNAAAVLSIDWTSGALGPPTVVDDDQRLVNQVTVSRPSGSQATAQDDDSIAAEGLHATSAQANAEGDQDLPDHAGWRLHLGVETHERWPNLPLILANKGGSALIPAWVTAPLLARVDVTNLPVQAAPPEGLDLFVEGRTQYVTPHLWEVGLATSAAQPYDVGVYGSASDPNGTGPDRYDTTDSELAADFVAGTDTSMSVTTNVGPIWTTDADDMPFEIATGGVILEVTAISGASSPQTFTITQTPVNGVEKTVPAGEVVSLAYPAFYAL